MDNSERTPLVRKVPSKHHNLAGYTAWHFRLASGTLWICTFFAAFDSTVLATLTSDISSHFNASNQGSWLGTAYLLSVCCFTPMYGRMSDIWSRRTAHLVAMFFFTLGTILCTFSPNMKTLIISRLIAGIGGGGVQSMAVIIMTDLVDLRHRGLFQGYANIIFGTGNALGGPIGGWLADSFGWRFAFGIQVPLLLIGAITTFFTLKGDLGNVEKRKKELIGEGNGNTDNEQISWKSKIKHIDYLGSLTLVTSIASLILALSLKTSSTSKDGKEYLWSDHLIIGLLSLSAISTILFIWVEAKISPAPILPMSLISRRTPAAVGLSLFIVATNQFSLLYNVPLFFTAVQLQTAGIAGAHLLPYSILMGIGSLTIGYIIRRTGKYWWLCVFSGMLVVFSSVVMCFWKNDSPGWLLWLGPIPGGFGYAGILTGTLVALMTEVQIVGKGEVAVATSMSYLFRTTGQVVGVSFSAAITQSILRSDLPQLIKGDHAKEIIDQIRHSTESIKHMEPQYQMAATQAYDHALRAVFIGNLILSVLGLVALLGIKEEDIPERKPDPIEEED